MSMEQEEILENKQTESAETESVSTENGQTESAETESTLAENEQMEMQGEPIYEVDVHINTSTLYDYFLRHVYTTFSGMLGTIIGVLMITFYFVKGVSLIYLICGVIIILYLPWTLYLTAKRQALQETFKNPLHYAFYGNGVEVSQGEVKQRQSWEDMLKAVSTSKSIILYTGKNSASIFPRKDLGDNAMGLIRIISTHMDPKKVKIKE